MGRRKAILLATTLACLGLSTEPAQAAPPYYEGKTLTVVVGYGPGGGYDRVARLMAKHLPKHIPGKPAVIVENMPGANSLIAANHLFSKAQPDGLTIGTFQRGLPFAQLLKAEGVRFDLTKFAWIGSAASESTVLTVRSNLPYKSVEDFLKMKEPLVVSTSGPADTGGQFAFLLSQAVGFKVKMISYPSSADQILALERGEVDARGGTYSSLRPFIERGVCRAVVRNRVAEPGAEKLPVNEDLVKDKKWKQLMALQSIPDVIGRPFVAPPKTPESVMSILRDAFAKAAQDPELQAEAKKLDVGINYVPADETLKILNDLLNQPPEIVAEIGNFMKF